MGAGYICWRACAYSSLLPVVLHKQFRFSNLKGVIPLFAMAVYIISEAMVQAGPLSTDALGNAQDKVRNRMTHALDRLDNALSPQRKFSRSTVREKWALFVGVNHFQDKSIEPLKCARNSALLLAKTFAQPEVGRFGEGHLATLAGYAATTHSIETALFHSSLMTKALPSDLIVLYFSTRLLPAKDSQDVCLCTYDTHNDQCEGSGIKLKEMLTSLRKRTQCQQIVCFLDCAPNSEDDKGYFKTLDIDRIAKDTGVSIVSASQLGSTAPSSGAGLISSFSQYVSEAMKVSGGAIPIGNLITYVQNSFAQDFQAGSGSTEQVVCAIAPGCEQIGEIHLGGRSRNGWSASQVNIGHNPDTLAAERPDLLQNGIRPPGQTIITGSKEPPVLVAERQTVNGSSPENRGDTSVVNVNYGMYMEKMKSDIRNKWRPPQGLEQHRVVTTFEIMRDGVIFEPAVTESSGIPAVDQSALDALKEASPLDPLPAGAPRSIAIRRYVFDWKVVQKL
jgi:hypothetical protein